MPWCFVASGESGSASLRVSETLVVVVEDRVDDVDDRVRGHRHEAGGRRRSSTCAAARRSSARRGVGPVRDASSSPASRSPTSIARAVAERDRMLRERHVEVLRARTNEPNTRCAKRRYATISTSASGMCDEVRARDRELCVEAGLALRVRSIDDEHDLRALRQRPQLRRDVHLEPARTRARPMRRPCRGAPARCRCAARRPRSVRRRHRPRTRAHRG